MLTQHYNGKGANDMVSRVQIAAVALLLTGLLASCNTTPADNSPATSISFEAAIGTLNFSNGQGLSILYRFATPDSAGQELNVMIEGPPGWNGDKPLHTTSRINSPASHLSWRNFSTDDAGDYLTMTSGTYTVTAEAAGATTDMTLTLSAEDGLSLPVSINVTATNTAATISWQAVEGATAYYVELYAPNGTLQRGVTKAYSSATEVTFPDLALITGTQYVAGVQAFTLDPTVDPPRDNTRPFHSSFASTRFTLAPQPTGLSPAVSTMQFDGPAGDDPLDR
jgi:VCBS repeat-containing protein